MTNRKAIIDKELFKSDPCRFLTNAIKTYAATSPLNTLTTFDNVPIFDEPLVFFANGDDPIFKEFKTIIGDFHWIWIALTMSLLSAVVESLNIRITDNFTVPAISSLFLALAVIVF